MKAKLLSAAALAAMIAMPVAAQAQSSGGAAAGATAGAVGGAVVGGPVGAVVGGATGAVVGGTLAGADETRFKEYVVREHRPSVRVKEKVAVGATLPSTVEYYEVPASVGVKTTYRYAVVNDQTVLVDPHTHKIVQVID
ncbi:hypothetical protein SLNSH_09900 [Alsobacter soli]|uniref:DUF1236 domain-containing protein n=1 Tax=Alsobacter soli TaxID=2109933 RepID=A0A2T1HUE2_9HYPH|nr:DUF1236 domain-containing protein [Alsobacter soli]PSC05248.1 hypothetical protein SLNSH_09900 [Alsobacter soli]